MGRHKMIKGVCRLCGNKTDLSFEHIPPKVSFNKNTKYTSVPFEDYFKVDNPLKHKPKGKYMQGGIGYNSLCVDCNNFLGRNYVNSYNNWVQAGHQILSLGKFYFYKYKIINQNPLFILKQIISMFISINDTWYLESYPELSEFVKDTKSNNLSERFRIFTYLNDEGGFRFSHHSVIYDPNLGGAVNCSEITFPPYGYVLTIDFDKSINRLVEITNFKSYPNNDNISLIFEMYKLPTYLPLPLDYREKKIIEKNIETSIKIKNDMKNEK